MREVAGEVNSRSPFPKEPRSEMSSSTFRDFFPLRCRGYPCPRKCETHGGFHIKLTFLNLRILIYAHQHAGDFSEGEHSRPVLQSPDGPRAQAWLRAWIHAA